MLEQPLHELDYLEGLRLLEPSQQTLRLPSRRMGRNGLESFDLALLRLALVADLPLEEVLHVVAGWQAPCVLDFPTLHTQVIQLGVEPVQWVFWCHPSIVHSNSRIPTLRSCGEMPPGRRSST